MTPIRMGVLSSQFSVLSSQFSVLRLMTSSLPFQFLHELPDADHRSTNRAASDLLPVVAGGDAQGIKTSVERLEYGLGFDARADAAGGAMFNVDGRPHSDLVAYAIRLQRVKRRCLHQADHVRRGIHRRQFRMMGREGVLELYRFLSFGARADGNLFGHSHYLSKKK